MWREVKKGGGRGEDADSRIIGKAMREGKGKEEKKQIGSSVMGKKKRVVKGDYGGGGYLPVFPCTSSRCSPILVKSGVPKGSVQPQTLILVFINDQLNRNQCPICSYNDDSTLHFLTSFARRPFHQESSLPLPYVDYMHVLRVGIHSHNTSKYYC